MKASNLPVLMHSKIVVKMSPANSREGIWEVIPCHKVLPIIFWKPFWREKASEGGLTSPPITKERVQRWRGETWGWKACREHVVPLQWSLAAVQHKVSWFHQVWRPWRDTEQLRKGSAWEKGFCAPEQMVFSWRLGLCSCLLARGQGEVETPAWQEVSLNSLKWEPSEPRQDRYLFKSSCQRYLSPLSDRRSCHFHSGHRVLPRLHDPQAEQHSTGLGWGSLQAQWHHLTFLSSSPGGSVGTTAMRKFYTQKLSVLFFF